jgi:hypothetical protein
MAGVAVIFNQVDDVVPEEDHAALAPAAKGLP